MHPLWGVSLFIRGRFIHHVQTVQGTCVYDLMQTSLLYPPFFTSTVEEDESAMPKKDSRLLLAKFNDQMEKLYELLRAVEDIRLAPEVTRQALHSALAV